MARNNNGNISGWVKWAVGLTLTFMLAVGGYAFAMIESKVSKERYLIDQARVCDQINNEKVLNEKKIDRIERKIDFMQSDINQIMIKLGQIEVRMGNTSEVIYGQND
jgi:hypothetical protein